ncbi:hypothetical protein BDP27DRAFT_1425305 [Rhodocollybia butyracea]|uniref:Uncharacterized protein n=1 Tax=Rhodocollybia butyracea TaxID=206335 RepID=A0A9P5PGV3_9AGAR|nr:hypothetical protein BDP27DRAFT_1427174 [Rhodocollybia butyracea]KAF9064908.1 hypothetical protein BDP27DRAFT_1425305 [Rhodocollybia butyracea]
MPTTRLWCFLLAVFLFVTVPNILSNVGHQYSILPPSVITVLQVLANLDAFWTMAMWQFYADYVMNGNNAY